MEAERRLATEASGGWDRLDLVIVTAFVALFLASRIFWLTTWPISSQYWEEGYRWLAVELIAQAEAAHGASGVPHAAGDDERQPARSSDEPDVRHRADSIATICACSGRSSVSSSPVSSSASR